MAVSNRTMTPFARRIVRSLIPLVAFGLHASALAQPAADPSAVVQELTRFPAAIDPGFNSRTGERPAIEQERESVYRRLRTLGASAEPALRAGLSAPDVRLRRGVALYLDMGGGNYAKHAAEALDLRPFLPALAAALRDTDQRVQELSAMALAHIGAPAAIAVPDLLRLLADPREGLRNSACIGLRGIGPAARDALPALEAALSDPSADVRRFAQAAIDRIRLRVS